MLDPSAYPDTFARDRLPPAELWPVFNRAALSAFGYPKRMNAATELLDKAVASGLGGRPCLRTLERVWTYEEIRSRANRIAHVLVEDLGLVPGNRVLLRGANTPMLAACWLAVLKAGGIAVATMPLLRARELDYIIDKAQVNCALCDVQFANELASCYFEIAHAFL